MNKICFPVYILNLSIRPDRKRHVLSELQNRKEFEIHISQAIENRIGSIGLWYSIQNILQNKIKSSDEFIILCEDDHQFTREYTIKHLYECIGEAQGKSADILIGGVSGFTSALHVSKSLYWVEKFSGLQFTIIFKKFFKTILEADLGVGGAADYKISSLSNNKFFIWPFISIQKDFGYSDVTPGNNVKGHVEKAFTKSNEKVKILKNINIYYKKIIPTIIDKTNPTDLSNTSIPTYIINLLKRSDRRKHIENQFRRRSEFEVRAIEACKHKIGAVGLWLSIKKIVETAIKNDDDVIIICEDDHEFTKHYRFDLLLSNIMQADQMGCNILSGGIGGFNMAVPLTENIFWMDSFWCTQFVIVFKRFFQAILNEPFTETDTADGKFSEMTSQKMVLYPFISVQKNFGYSDVTFHNNRVNNKVENRFEESSKRLNILQNIYKKYGTYSVDPTMTSK